MRAIQYAATYPIDHGRQVLLGRPVKPGDDDLW
jgi:hypothetical protein